MTNFNFWVNDTFQLLWSKGN